MRPGTEASGAEIDYALEALRDGELIVYPTETFYGVGADAFSEQALARLFSLKGRDPGKPIALIAFDEATALSLWRQLPAGTLKLARAFWPGPLTLVLPARPGIPGELLGAGGSVGVRVSSHPTARALAAGLGHPITATSANLSGETPATTLAEARTTFDGKIKVFVEGGTLPGGLPSTVAAFSQGRWSVIREGAISEQALQAALGDGDIGREESAE